MTNREKQKEKLTDLIIESVNGCARHWAEIISDHLLDSGNVIVTPCKVGDTVYRVEHDCADPTDSECDDDCYHCKYHFMSIHDAPLNGLHKVITAMENWEKYYFLTREAAEQALKEREQ